MDSVTIEKNREVSAIEDHYELEPITLEGSGGLSFINHQNSEETSNRIFNDETEDTSESELPSIFINPSIFETSPSPSTASANECDELESSSEYSGDGSDIYEVEKIVAKRQNRLSGLMEYRVKWKDYPSSENTWEPEKNIYNPALIQEFADSENVKLLKRRMKKKEASQRRLQNKKGKKKTEAENKRPLIH